jgi:hypothetical protein
MSLREQIDRMRRRNEERMADLWTLTRCYPSLDPLRLARAVESAVSNGKRLDYRTRLLVRDSMAALERHWGRSRLAHWLRQSPAGQQIECILREPFDEVGFPSLESRIMDGTDPDLVKTFFRDLASHLSEPVRLDVGGSMALILTGYLARGTEVVDVVDEVPAPLRQLPPQIVDPLMKRYGLRLAHFQSHYLPAGWKERLAYFEEFGRLRLYLVDAYDVFLSKLFSVREKDRDDLLVLVGQLNKEAIVSRLRASAASLNAEPALQANAQRNWAILYNGEALPAAE